MPRPDAPQSILTLGTFDGVHRGHAALVQRARHLANKHSRRPRVVALAFDPHPLTALAPARAPARLSTWEQRVQWLRDAGADDVVRLVPSADLLHQTPEQFVNWLITHYAPCAIVEGPDFRFGHQRTGDVGLLAELGRSAGFVVDVLDPVETALSDQSVVPISSTMIRWLIERGRVDDAAGLLGRQYEIVGTVVRGDRRGRQLGFPTANIETPCMFPGDGVYAGVAIVPTGEAHLAAIHVGPRATFDAPQRTLEAHILDWAGPGPSADEYGWPIRIQLAAFLRDQARFDSLDALVAQIRLDIARTRRLAGVRQLAEALR